MEIDEQYIQKKTAAAAPTSQQMGGTSVQLTTKNKECSLYGVLIDKINPHQPISAKMERLITFITYLQSQESLVRSYRFSRHESQVTCYAPSPLISLGITSMPPLIQHVTQTRLMGKDAIYRNQSLTSKDGNQLRKRKDELRMYLDNIELKNGVTVKICDRTIIKESASEDFSLVQLNEHQEMQVTEAEMLIRGSGYEVKRSYSTEGETYTFIMNEFADLQEMIHLDRRHISYKCKLSIFKVYDNNSDPSNILGRVIDVECEPDFSRLL